MTQVPTSSSVAMGWWRGTRSVTAAVRTLWSALREIPAVRLVIALSSPLHCAGEDLVCAFSYIIDVYLVPGPQTTL